MTSKSSSKPVGVIGSGSFGSAIANILAENSEVLLYSRDEATIKKILETRQHRGHQLHENITPCGDLKYVAEECDIIFPIVPSSAFRSMMKGLSPYLHPYHILIHGTKGLDIRLKKNESLESIKTLSRERIMTMSEVIMDESVVVRV